MRGANSYGNMLLFRETSSPVQWLHVSKYPPSLSFYSLELGIMAMLLSFAFASFAFDMENITAFLPPKKPFRLRPQ